MNYEKKQRIQTFTDLDAWREGHTFVVLLYRATKEFPDDERFGLIPQLRRAAVSITSNIAEGFSRGTYKDKIRFYEMALGSVTEVQNQLLIARDIDCLQAELFQTLADQSVIVHKLINGLIKASRHQTRRS